MRQTWVLRDGGFQLGGQKRPGRARERRKGWLTAIVAMTQEKEKEGKRNGRGGTRVSTPIDVGTVRGSDEERGDRRAEERQKRVQT
jgi:hypothetical protein